MNPPAQMRRWRSISEGSGCCQQCCDFACYCTHILCSSVALFVCPLSTHGTCTSKLVCSHSATSSTVFCYNMWYRDTWGHALHYWPCPSSAWWYIIAHKLIRRNRTDLLSVFSLFLVQHNQCSRYCAKAWFESLSLCLVYGYASLVTDEYDDKQAIPTNTFTCQNDAIRGKQ